jgi:hypothetical protein
MSETDVFFIVPPDTRHLPAWLTVDWPKRHAICACIGFRCRETLPTRVKCDGRTRYGATHSVAEWRGSVFTVSLPPPPPPLCLLRRQSGTLRPILGHPFRVRRVAVVPTVPCRASHFATSRSVGFSGSSGCPTELNSRRVVIAVFLPAPHRPPAPLWVQAALPFGYPRAAANLRFARRLRPKARPPQVAELGRSPERFGAAYDGEVSGRKHAAPWLLGIFFRVHRTGDGENGERRRGVRGAGDDVIAFHR